MASRTLVSNNKTICVRCLITKVWMLMKAAHTFCALFRDYIWGLFWKSHSIKVEYDPKILQKTRDLLWPPLLWKKAHQVNHIIVLQNYLCALFTVIDRTAVRIVCLYHNGHMNRWQLFMIFTNDGQLKSKQMQQAKNLNNKQTYEEGKGK